MGSKEWLRGVKQTVAPLRYDKILGARLETALFAALMRRPRDGFVAAGVPEGTVRARISVAASSIDLLVISTTGQPALRKRTRLYRSSERTCSTSA